MNAIVDQRSISLRPVAIICSVVCVSFKDRSKKKQSSSCCRESSLLSWWPGCRLATRLLGRQSIKRYQKFPSQSICSTTFKEDDFVWLLFEWVIPIPRQSPRSLTDEDASVNSCSLFLLFEPTNFCRQKCVFLVSSFPHPREVQSRCLWSLVLIERAPKSRLSLTSIFTSRCLQINVILFCGTPIAWHLAKRRVKCMANQLRLLVAWKHKCVTNYCQSDQSEIANWRITYVLTVHVRRIICFETRMHFTSKMCIYCNERVVNPW